MRKYSCYHSNRSLTFIQSCHIWLYKVENEWISILACTPPMCHVTNNQAILVTWLHNSTNEQAHTHLVTPRTIPMTPIRAFLEVFITWPYKYFFTSKFSYVLFYNPTHKTQTGTTNTWGTTNSKPLGPIIMMGHSKTLNSSQIAFITLFTAGARCCYALYQPLQTLQFCWAKTIFLNQTAMF